MRSDRHWPVAIIGGGFSGTMSAAQLARKGAASVLIDEFPRVEGAPRLCAIGPLTKGAFWEIVAVPDIRTQAAAVAETLPGSPLE